MTDPWVQVSPITARMFLALARLSGGTIVGGMGGADRLVERVRVSSVHERHETTDLTGTALLLDGTQLTRDTFVVDMILRRMSERGGSVLVVVSPAIPLSLASRRIANRFDVPLVVIEDDLLDLADALRDEVTAPARTMAAVAVEAIDRLSAVGPQRALPRMLSIIEDLLHAHACLVGFEGQVLGGEPVEPAVAARDRLDVPTRTVLDARVRLVHPVQLAAGEGASFWLVVEHPAPSAGWEQVARRVATLTARYVALLYVSQRLEQERDARVRLGALNAIVAVGERPTPALVQQLGILGWSTQGWCSAVHLRLGAGFDSAQVLSLTVPLQRAIAHLGFGPIVERPDGWTTWWVSPVEPLTSSYPEAVVAVRRALQDFVRGREEDGLRIYAGIGRPSTGIVGLRRSLAEAQDAATIAQAAGTRTAVQHIDELGMQRILVGWYTSSEFGDFARTLLRPVAMLDKDEDLTRTLEVYLDNESSPTATADVLGVHRNTIIKRLARIREVLAVDLDDPDQRLAVQLACRVANLKQQQDEPGPGSDHDRG
ncbi:MAG: PucR family transcriptional regulator [Actinomycetales bacterium]